MATYSESLDERESHHTRAAADLPPGPTNPCEASDITDGASSFSPPDVVLVTQFPASPNHPSPSYMYRAHPFVSRDQLSHFRKLHIRIFGRRGLFGPPRFSRRRPWPNRATSPTSFFHGLSVHGSYSAATNSAHRFCRRHFHTAFGEHSHPWRVRLVSAPFFQTPWRIRYSTFLPPSMDSAILYARVRIGAIRKSPWRIRSRTFLPPSMDAAILYARVRIADLTTPDLTTRLPPT